MLGEADPENLTLEGGGNDPIDFMFSCLFNKESHRRAVWARAFWVRCVVGTHSPFFLHSLRFEDDGVDEFTKKTTSRTEPQHTSLHRSNSPIGTSFDFMQNFSEVPQGAIREG